MSDDEPSYEGQPLSYWAGVVMTGDAASCIQAATALNEMSWQAAPAAQAVIERLLPEVDLEVRVALARTLGELGPEARDGVPVLLACLVDTSSSELRAVAATSLGKIGDIAAAPSLLEAFKDEDASVRCQAATAAGMRDAADQVLWPLAELLMQDVMDDTKRAAALALGRLGDLALPAMGTIISALKHENRFLRNDAALALGGLGAEATGAVEPLLEVLGSDEDVLPRRGAATALGQLHINAAQVVPALIKTLGYEADPPTRTNAAIALSNFTADEAAPAAVQLAFSMQRDGDPQVRAYTAMALGSIGEHARPHLTALEQATHDADDTVRTYAKNALRQVRPEGSFEGRALDDAIAVLESGDSHRALELLRALRAEIP